jgi:hypothetical protein
MAEAPGTTTPRRVGHTLVATRALKRLILQHRERINADRQLPQPILEAMAHLGLFRALVPVSARGEEWEWPTHVQF